MDVNVMTAIEIVEKIQEIVPIDALDALEILEMIEQYGIEMQNGPDDVQFTDLD